MSRRSGHVESARKVILTLPVGVERDEWELAFLSIEGTTRMALDGWDSPSASQIYGAAREVAERLGRPQNCFAQWMGTNGWGRIRTANTPALMRCTRRSLASLIGSTNPNTSFRLTTRVARRWSPRGAPRLVNCAHRSPPRELQGWTFTAILLCFTALMIRDAAHLACARLVS